MKNPPEPLSARSSALGRVAAREASDPRALASAQRVRHEQAAAHDRRRGPRRGLPSPGPPGRPDRAPRLGPVGARPPARGRASVERAARLLSTAARCRVGAAGFSQVRAPGRHAAADELLGSVALRRVLLLPAHRSRRRSDVRQVKSSSLALAHYCCSIDMLSIDH